MDTQLPRDEYGADDPEILLRTPEGPLLAEALAVSPFPGFQASPSELGEMSKQLHIPA